jgi:hypothetical protein
VGFDYNGGVDDVLDERGRLSIVRVIKAILYGDAAGYELRRVQTRARARFG